MLGLVRNMRYSSLLVILVILFSCGSNEMKEESQQYSNDIQDSTQNKVQLFPNTGDTVLTYKVVKKNDPQCRGWKEPSNVEIIPILNLLHEIQGTEWHDCYGDWSCSVEGELIFKNVKYKYWLDAAGWIILHDGSNQKFFGCRTDECWKFFASERFCDEEGNILD